MPPRHDNDPCTEFKVYNLELSSQNTEYSQVLDNAVRKLSIQCRDAVDVKFSTTAGNITAGLYQTIKAGAEKYLDNIWVETMTLYFETEDTGSPVIEIEVWSG